MSRRFDNKRLFFLLSGLILILILTVIIKIPKEKATFKSSFADFDTSAVTRIILNNRISEGNLVEFNRINAKWTVQQGKIVSATQAGAVENIFGEVLNIRPQSLAAIDKSKWNEFNLTDSLATRIKFLNSKGKILADIMIGKLDFKQAEKPAGGYSGNNVQVTSYVRLYNRNEVYAVDGLLQFSFNIKFEDWRDKTFVHSKKDDITSIRFIYPADSSYTLLKKGSTWYAGNQKADSSSVANYLNLLVLMYGQGFKDGYKPVLNPAYQMLVEGDNLLKFSVKCYEGESAGEYILNSSLNPDVYYSSEKNGIFNQLFKPQKNFVKK
ncbi:MAG: DUF4340 domain-containing protein [Bacteroidales bacterium]|jgi:hypothetical protein